MMKNIVDNDTFNRMETALYNYCHFLSCYEEELKGKFALFDTDKDGFITPGKELKELALARGREIFHVPSFKEVPNPHRMRGCPPTSWVNIPYTDEELNDYQKRILEKFDKNHDQKISFEEYKKILIDIEADIHKSNMGPNFKEVFIDAIEKYKKSLKEFIDKFTVEDIKKAEKIAEEKEMLYDNKVLPTGENAFKSYDTFYSTLYRVRLAPYPADDDYYPEHYKEYEKRMKDFPRLLEYYDELMNLIKNIE